MPGLHLFLHRTVALGFALLLALSACEKPQWQTVGDNTPPPDTAITALTQETYINRAYINLLGRKPTTQEQESASTLLKSRNFHSDDRQTFVNGLFAKAEYRPRLFDRAWADLLRSTDTNDLKITYVRAQEIYDTTRNSYIKAKLGEALQRGDLLLKARAQFVGQASPAINYLEVHKRLSYNTAYDQINMGTLNFVVSLYEYFLKRSPTGSELLNDSLMVEGRPSVSFGQVGRTKNDYVNVFFDTNDYLEGQVRLFYRQFLFREPSSAEMAYLTQRYRSTGRLEEIHLYILTTNEYAGIR